MPALTKKFFLLLIILSLSALLLLIAVFKDNVRHRMSRLYTYRYQVHLISYNMTALQADRIIPRYNFNLTLIDVARKAAAASTGTDEVTAKQKMLDLKEPLVSIQITKFHTPSGVSLTANQVLKLLGDPHYTVPNVIHYVLPFEETSLRFHHLVCLLSGFWVVKPLKVIFWYSRLPKGEYWRYLKKNVTSERWEKLVIFAHRPPPIKIYSAEMRVREHQSDVMRLEAVMAFGGIYLDLDVIVLKPLEPLRNFSLTLGRETTVGVCNGIILAERGNPFLGLWHLAYQLMKDRQWAHLSVLFPNKLSQLLPDFCHVEEESLNRPNWEDGERDLIYGNNRTWDWENKNFAVHLWYRFHKRDYTFSSIKNVNSMLGDMFRFILFGNSVAMVT